jgi:hypothetical protein
MALGPRDLSSLVLLTGWDATALEKVKLEDGTTYGTIVSQMNAALAALNAELTTDQWGQLVSYTDQPDVEYRVGVSNGFEEYTEYSRADPQRAATEGHMIPLKPWDRRLGWTWSYLKRARASQITADIRSSIDDARDLWRQKILTRLLKRGDDSGVKNGLGATGLSPGFATTAGSTGVDFVPPSFGGTSFTNTHEHYVGIGGGVFTNAVFEDAHQELAEHGHEPPYEFWIGPSDQLTVEGLTKFVPAANALVRLGITQDVALVGEGYIGTIEGFKIRVVRGIPQYYGIGFKTYGANSPRNPLVIRLEKGVTRPRIIAMPDPQESNGSFPLQHLMLYVEFGVGVADRTAATPRYVNNATWADGTAT